MRKLVAAFLAVAFAAGLAACGERPQVVTYKQGTYQGKPDTQPWSNPPYNGNKEQWEQAIRARMQSQTEYKNRS
jgi:hypothetical protein